MEIVWIGKYRTLTVVRPCFIYQRGILPGVHQIEFLCQRLHTMIHIQRNLWFSYFTSFGRDQNHTIGAPSPIDCRCRRIFHISMEAMSAV